MFRPISRHNSLLNKDTDTVALQWRHNERDGISNHPRLDCLLDRLLRPRSKKTSNLRVTGLCEGNSPVTGEFPPQRASNAENVSVWWRHHVCFKDVLVGQPSDLCRFHWSLLSDICLTYKETQIIISFVIDQTAPSVWAVENKAINNSNSILTAMTQWKFQSSKCNKVANIHYCDDIMSELGSQITSVSIVCSIVGSGADQRKSQSCASLAFERGIHRWAANCPHQRLVTRKMVPFDDVRM